MTLQAYVVASNGKPVSYVPEAEGWTADKPFVPTPDMKRALRIYDKAVAEETADVINAIASATPGATVQWAAIKLP